METENSSETVRILIDHNIEGWASLLWNTMITEGWLDIFHIDMLMFADVGLDDNSNDREVWHFAQSNRMMTACIVKNVRNVFWKLFYIWKII